jgi:uncharacterized protein (TIGR00730 family)
MSKGLPKPEKAYKNLDFLNSPDARIIRIMAEYLEPMKRFSDEKVADTIVFFGSARTKELPVAQQELAAAEQRLAAANQDNKTALLEELEFAKNQVFMARYYEDAVELARRLTTWSETLHPNHRFVISSGGGPGMMEAANRGSLEAGGKSIGLNISLPMEQYANPYITPELNFEFHYFFIRKFWFVYLAKALIIFPGGFGTLDELFEVLTLIQTKKVLKPMPICIYGTEYWNQVMNLEAMVKYGTISKEDLDLVQFCDSVDCACDYLMTELSRYYL